MKTNRGFERVTKEQWEKDSDTVGTQSENGDPILLCSIDEVILPKRATANSAGYDLFSPCSFILLPGEEILLPFGWKVYMKPEECFIVIPRSGMGFKYYIRLANTIGLIDPDYYNNKTNEGHCWIKLRNEGEKIMSVERGKAIAQGVFLPFLLADGDDEKGERAGGLGSTDEKEASK